MLKKVPNDPVATHLAGRTLVLRAHEMNGKGAVDEARPLLQRALGLSPGLLTDEKARIKQAMATPKLSGLNPAKIFGADKVRFKAQLLEKLFWIP